MAEYKQVDLQIGTEAQFESKKETLPIGTIVGITDPIHKSELDSDLQTSIDSIANKLDKPSGNPTEDSFVKVSSTGAVSYEKITKLYAYTLTVTVDMGTESESNYVITVFSTLEEFTSGQFNAKYGNSVVPCIYRLATAPSKTFGQLQWVSEGLHLELEDGTAKIIGHIITDSKVEI